MEASVVEMQNVRRLSRLGKSYVSKLHMHCNAG
jgi:hypothetical protein